MEVSTILIFSLLLCGIKAIHADDSLAALATRVRLVEGKIDAWNITDVNSEIKLMNRFEVLESSLREELAGKFLPPPIKPLVKLAITEIMKGDYIGNIISGHVLDEVQSLKASVLNTKTELKSLSQQLRRVERDRDTNRKSLRKQRRRLTEDIRTFQLHLNQTVADLGENARMLNFELNKTNHDLSDTKQKVNVLTGDIYTLNTSSVMMRNEVESCVERLQEIRLKLPTDIQSLTSQLNQTKEDLLDSRGVISDLTEDINTLNTSSVMMRNEVVSCVDGLQEIRLKLPTDIQSLTSQLNQTKEDLLDSRGVISDLTEDINTLNTSSVMMRNEVVSCVDGLQEIRLKLPTDIQSLTSQLNQTKEDLLDTKELVNGLTEDVMTLNVSCWTRKEIIPSDGNESFLRTSSSSLLSHTTLTTTFHGTTAAPVTTENSNLQASTTDAREDLTTSKTDPPTPVPTQDSDAHATLSPATVRDLYDASEDGDLKRVKRILDAGQVDINTRVGHRWRWTPVMMAARSGHRDVVEFLVDRGADVSLVDGDGDNVLHFACYGGDLETVNLILSLDVVDINSRGEHSWTPVMAAAMYGHRDVVEFLVIRGADMSLVDRDRSNVLHYACRGGDLETVKLILSLDVVDINSRGLLSWTPVMAAAEYGHSDVVEFLVGRGADVSLVSRNGNNVLHYACYGGDLETVKLILSLNVVDINARDNDGKTAADYARVNKHQRVVDFLVSRGGH